MKHTPTPWKITDSGDILCHDGPPDLTYLITPPGETSAEIRANANLIVQAVNSHDELIDALESAKQFLHEVHCRWPEDADYGGSVLIDVDKALHNAKKEPRS